MVSTALRLTIPRFRTALAPSPAARALAQTGRALQITVALSVFKEDAGYAAGIPLIYGAIEPLVIAPFCLFAWKAGLTYCPRDASFAQWLFTNYQPETDEKTTDAPNAAGGDGARSGEGDAKQLRAQQQLL